MKPCGYKDTLYSTYQFLKYFVIVQEKNFFKEIHKIVKIVELY